MPLGAYFQIVVSLAYINPVRELFPSISHFVCREIRVHYLYRVTRYRLQRHSPRSRTSGRPSPFSSRSGRFPKSPIYVCYAFIWFPYSSLFARVFVTVWTEVALVRITRTAFIVGFPFSQVLGISPNHKKPSLFSGGWIFWSMSSQHWRFSISE